MDNESCDDETGDDETEKLREFDWEEWSEFGWRNEACRIPKARKCITKWARSVIFKEEDNDGRERVTEEEEQVSIWGESTEIKLGLQM